ncbi:unnamed protein product [Caenorhabditis brenneri]
MQLLKFPWLVKQKILKSMRTRDTFTMSLCSQRMYNLIRLCKIRTARLFYRDCKDGLSVYNRSDETSNDEIVYIRIVQKYKHDSDETKVTFDAHQMSLLLFKWRPWGIEYIDSVLGPIQRMTQNHINGLFHHSDVGLELCYDNLQQGYYPDISNVTDILFTSDNMKSDTFHEILQKHPSLKSLDINEIDGSVPENSNLFKVKEVSMILSPGMTRMFLENFSGSQADLYEAELNETDVFNCVTDWISGRKYHNLNELVLKIVRGGLDIDIVLNSLLPLAKNTVMPDKYEGFFRYQPPSSLK